MIKLAFLNLFRRKSRTALAFIGIIIGITAIMGMVSTVDGVLGEFTDIITNMQAIEVYEKGVIDQTLSQLPLDYQRKLESVQGVKMVIPELWILPTSINDKPPRIFTTVAYGLDPFKLSQLSASPFGLFEDVEGKRLEPGDRGVAVVGRSMADEYNLFVGSSFEYNDKKFKVKGIYDSANELMGGIILIPYNDARELTNLDNDMVGTFYIELEDPSKDEEVSKLIEFKFDDVTAFSSATFSEEYGGILDNFRLVVFAVAAISALVAGVGIANTILMSVMERKKEIGTLKAVGWTDFDVMRMILMESAILGIVGGLLGLVSGYSVSWAIQEFGGLTTRVTLELTAISFVFAVSLGIAAGLYPAYRASKLNPIEALGG
jgi:putative ABC transport system permease protein